MRRVVSITGTRADYGPMEPVHRAIADAVDLDLHLVVTAMHFRPEFAESLAQVRVDRLGTLHELPTLTPADNNRAMSDAIAVGLRGLGDLFDRLQPDVVLLQGDRGEMLSGAIVAAHLNIPIVHMSGGDVSGSIDDSIRDAISSFAHIHLTNCQASTERLLAMGEPAGRIVTVGEPGLDQLLRMELVPIDQLRAEVGLGPAEPFLVATLHPVTDESEQAADQMTTFLDALEQVGLAVVCTYPNSDAGGQAMRAVLESRSDRGFLKLVPNLGSRRYLSLIRHASAVVGNSSSGLFDTPTLKTPAVNIGSRQTGRTRAANVFDAPFDRGEIVDAIHHVLQDRDFRRALADCRNPFGDGRAAERTVAVLRTLRLGPALTAKWKPLVEPLFESEPDGL